MKWPILFLLSIATPVFFFESLLLPLNTVTEMNTDFDNKPDSVVLHELNAQFIKNFLTQDAGAHSKIIHKNFVCIESNGHIISREEYLKNWATDYNNSGYVFFTYKDELIRIFGDIALVRSTTVYQKQADKQPVTGYTVYTDTYLKEEGNWKCIQVQITPVK